MASEYNSQRYHNTQSSLHSQQPTQAKIKVQTCKAHLMEAIET
jgi:hypothetical protein